MKTKILVFVISAFISTATFAQLMPFGFVKNCMSYARTTTTDELNKKHFSLIDRNYQKANNPLLISSTYYSNEPDRTPGLAEIAVLSLINGSKQITEISFISDSKTDYSKNYEDIYKQMVSFFKDEKSFKSPKYNEDINYFIKDKVYYYTYKVKETPIILISNYKIDEDYFGKK